MKASAIRPGDWVITGGSITDTVRYVRDYPDAGVIVTTETGEECSYHPDAEVTMVDDGHRIYRPTAGTISQLFARRHRLMRAGRRCTTDERATALILASLRVVAALKVMNVEDPAA